MHWRGGSVTHISNRLTPELDVSYFFTQNISAELILATSRHNVTVGNSFWGKQRFYHRLSPSNIIHPIVWGVGIGYRI